MVSNKLEPLSLTPLTCDGPRTSKVAFVCRVHACCLPPGFLRFIVAWVGSNLAVDLRCHLSSAPAAGGQQHPSHRRQRPTSAPDTTRTGVEPSLVHLTPWRTERVAAARREAVAPISTMSM